jgi:mono/diheme cytochrome c family protein
VILPKLVRPSRHLLLVFASIAVATAIAGTEAAKDAREHPLLWDAMEKTVDAKPGEGVADFTFNVTNKSDHMVTVTDVHTSCGCTVAELPNTPWKLAPGATGSMGVTVDFAGKDGRVTKSVEVESSEGLQTLLVNVNVPLPDEARRERNRRLATANRQAVFRNDCATCHAQPAGTKTGVELFQAVCLVCHASPHRASMVPDLLVAREHRDAAYWRKWITEGREQSLMPAFAQERGGPLTAAQIDSLVEFGLKQLPTEPRAKE